MLKATKTKAYCNEEVRNYGKILFIQSIVGRWGECIPPPPLDPFLTGTLLFQTDDNRASQGRMRYVLFYSYGRTTVSKLVVWKANGNLLQGSVNGFKIAPPSSGRGSTSCKLPDNSVIDTSLG